MAVVVPNAIALAGIVDGSAIVASDHRNNYSAVQVGVNGLIAMFTAAPVKGDLIVSAGGGSFDKLGVGANGAVVTADSTQPLGVKWAASSGGSQGAELAYAQVTASVVVAVAAEAAAQTVLTLPATVFDGAPVMVEFFCPNANPSGAVVAQLIVSLWEGATNLTRLLACTNEVASASGQWPLVGAYRFTPSAASHTYIIKANCATGQWTFNAGAGGVAGNPPMFARITKV